MKSRLPTKLPDIPLQANFVMEGSGPPVVLVHGLAASLHDWDALVPGLVKAGYSTYAVDLLGHGDSPKPDAPLYQMDWLVGHFVGWLQRLNLLTPPVLVGHSLGGYIVLEYARRFPDRVRALVLVDPFYDEKQLPWGSRLVYAHPTLSAYFIGHTPGWIARFAIDLMSMLIGHSRGGLHALPKEVRAQTALDYLRTAPAAYGILRGHPNLTPYLPSITAPTLVVWGRRDRTLAPSSYPALVRALPRAKGGSRATGHVLHQAEAAWFGEEVLDFLVSLSPPQRSDPAAVARDALSTHPGDPHEPANSGG
jgi:pimeloyl-ACP methyl ester carboxylesterase